MLTATVVLGVLIALPPYLPDGIKRNAFIVWLLAEPDGGTYATVLTTVAGMAGVFLALYFTALSVVASTSYSHVTSTVRTLVVDEVFGAKYLGIVAHLAALATVCLALFALDVDRNRSVLVYVAVLAALVIFAFAPLGRRIFAFFDPRTLATQPARDFQKWMIEATPHGSRWTDPAFQRFFRQKGLAALELLDNLVDYARSEEDRRPEVLTGLTKQLLNLLHITAFYSCRIPGNSLWFERSASFMRWELLSSAETDLYLRTSVGPFPKETPNHLFAEQRLSRSIEKAIEALMEGGRIQALAGLMPALYRTCSQLGGLLAVTEAFMLIELARKQLVPRLLATDLSEKSRRLAALSITSAIGGTYTSVVLAATKRIRELPKGRYARVAADLNGRSPKRLYTSQHPRPVLSHLEPFYEGPSGFIVGRDRARHRRSRSPS